MKQVFQGGVGVHMCGCHNLKCISSLSLPSHLRGCFWLGAVLHQRREDGGCKEDKKCCWNRSPLGPTLLWKVESAFWGTSKFWRWSEKAKRNWSSLPAPVQPWKSEIAYNAMLAQTGAHHCRGNSMWKILQSMHTGSQWSRWFWHH